MLLMVMICLKIIFNFNDLKHLEIMDSKMLEQDLLLLKDLSLQSLKLSLLDDVTFFLDKIKFILEAIGKIPKLQ